MSEDYKGFQALGQLIGGGRGNDNTSDAYIDGMKGGYQVQEAGFKRDKTREEARRARSIAIAREALPDAVLKAYGEEAGPLAAAVLGSNNTVDLDQLGDLAVPGSLQAFQAGAAKLRDGNAAGYNDELAIATGKERTPYTLGAGGKATIREDTGEVVLTDLGDAALVSENAQALARQASAAAAKGRERVADATVRKVDRTDPNARKGGSSNPARADAAMPAGARKGKDGKFYVPDPDRPGKYLMVEN